LQAFDNLLAFQHMLYLLFQCADHGNFLIQTHHFVLQALVTALLGLNAVMNIAPAHKQDGSGGNRDQ
jgi:hypothetical protein